MHSNAELNPKSSSSQNPLVYGKSFKPATPRFHCATAWNAHVDEGVAACAPGAPHHGALSV